LNKPFPDLSSFVGFLETRGNLKRIRAEADPRFEITEIAARSVRLGGPALLFENVKGSRFPLLINLFASKQRIEWALGRPASEAGEEIASFLSEARTPTFSGLWRRRRTASRLLGFRLRRMARGPVREVTENPDLDSLPALTCWPGDAGRFLTFPLVISRSPSSGIPNAGVYRMQVFDKGSTGMHWQIHRGGGFHYFEAERAGKPLPLAVVLGADPVSMLAAVLPLPEDVDELGFAGFLRGKSTRTLRLANGLDVPAAAEFVLEGEVAPAERKVEGPFGDHFGHYSRAAPYPVFRVARVHRRKNAIYPASIVGKPPQEDKFLGDAAQEMLVPLMKLLHPELVDLRAYYETGFHNLAVASVRQRYAKEAVRTGLWLLGEGQMALTKCVILVDPAVNVRNFEAVLDSLRENFDPREDLHLLQGTMQDTLDFTGPRMNLGSKMILDATSFGKDRAGLPKPEPLPASLPGMTWRSWRGALLAVHVKDDAKPVLERLVRDPAVRGYRLVVAVSPDVPLGDPELLLWGIFTRFDCARDLVPAGAAFSAGGAWALFDGPIGIDATWKPGYPEALRMAPEIVERVDRRWKELEIQSC